MRFKEIDIPEVIIKAQQEGKLVVFVGAGVSIASGCPSFLNLVKLIAEDVKATSITDDVPLDRYLGQLEDRGVKVHKRTREILEERNKGPNELHKFIIDLFNKEENIKIVTTNFDVNLTECIINRFPSLPVYRAPALPPGNRIKGIVYLHGCIDVEHSDLVLTDRNFSVAYLTEGWATRFLISLFKEYTVLFIGYSYNDTIMQYLARGLPAEGHGKSFVLTHESGGNWNFLNLQAIKYSLRDGEKPHGALPEALQKWASHTQKNMSAHSDRVREILSSNPSLIPDDADYIKHIIQDNKKTHLFSSVSPNFKWLQWLEDENLLTSFFDPNSNLSDGELRMVSWISNFFITEQYALLNFLAKYQGKLHPNLCNNLVSKIKNMPKENIIQGSWIPLLIQNTLVENLNFFLLVFHEKVNYIVEPRNVFVLLFEYATKIKLVIGATPYFKINKGDSSVANDVEMTIKEDHVLRKVWEGHFKTNLQEYAELLEPILIKNIQQSYLLMHTALGNDKESDILSYRRRCIKEDEQDKYNHCNINFLIDAMRDILDWYASVKHERLTHFIFSNLQSEVTLLKRLAIYGLTIHLEFTTDQKIYYLIDNKLLFQYPYKAEVFDLIENTFSTISETVKERLLEEINEGRVEEIDLEVKNYEIYNLLIWIDQIAPNDSLVMQKITEIREKYPSFSEIQRPDLNHPVIMNSTTKEFISPILLNELIRNEPKDILDFLLNYKPEYLGAPSRHALLNEISKVFVLDDIWGWKLIQSLIEGKYWESDIWRAIINGWFNTVPIGRDQDKIFSLIEQHSEILNHIDNIVIWFSNWCMHLSESTNNEVLNRALVFSNSLWNCLLQRKKETPLESNNWYDDANNTAEGKLADCWLKILSISYNKRQDERYQAVIFSLERILENIINSDSASAELIRIKLCSELGFLIYINRIKVKKYLIPLFANPNKPKAFQQAWHGLLGPRIISYYAFLFIRKYIPEAVSHLNGNLLSRQDAFVIYLTFLPVFSKIKPIHLEILEDALRKMGESNRVNWASHFTLRLNGLTSGERQVLWNKWLKIYWRKRNDGYIAPLCVEEIYYILRCVFKLPEVFPEAANLLCQIKIDEPCMGVQWIYDVIDWSFFIEKYPVDLAKLLLHILPKTEKILYASDIVGPVISELQGKINEERIKKELENLVAELGI